MARLSEDSPAYYYGGEVYEAGDELPGELAHLAKEDTSVDPSPASSSGDPNFDPEKATVPQLRAELDRLGVDYDQDDRKDALRAKYESRIAS